MKCQTCIHRYVCKNLFVYSQIDFERCINYRLDESTVSKRRFANVKKTHHIAEVSKKVKSVYPVKSERLCEKCFYKNLLYIKPCTSVKEIYKTMPVGNDFLIGTEEVMFVKDGQPCKYFKRRETE